jgi:hypothetical protein
MQVVPKQAPSALETMQILIRLPLAGSRASKLIGGGVVAASSPPVFASLGLRLYSACQGRVVPGNSTLASVEMCGACLVWSAAGCSPIAASDNKQMWAHWLRSIVSCNTNMAYMLNVRLHTLGYASWSYFHSIGILHLYHDLYDRRPYAPPGMRMQPCR